MPRISLLTLMLLTALNAQAQSACESQASASTAADLYFDPSQPLKLSAERQQWSEPGQSQLQGSVVAEQGDIRLTADQLEYASDGSWQTQGPVELSSPAGRLQGQNLRGKNQPAELEIEQLHYQFFAPYRQGSASYLKLQPQSAKLEQATYTSCSGEDPDWLMTAGDIRLNREKGWGEADDMVLRVQDIPVFYLPYLSFPIDSRRRSGVLFPSFGFSTENGLDYAQPYYLNLAPDYDALLTPRHIQNRGLQLQTEFRYLLPKGSGQLNIEYLPDDNQVEREADRNRSLFDWQQKLDFGQYWHSELRYSEVSDNNYLHDLGSGTNLAADSPLERQVSLTYQREFWSTNTAIRDYQVLDSPTVPYQILPRVGLEGDFYRAWRGLNLTYGFNHELVRFRHPTATNAERGDLSLYLGLPMEFQSAYIHPRLQWQYTAYNQTDPELGANFQSQTLSTLDANPSRSLPLLQLDSGLWLERPLELWGQNYLQTLEPQLNYLYVPYRNQDRLGLYDTAEITSGFESLLRSNRFIGRDRIGDDNRLTLVLSSRVLREDDGTERLRVRLGRSLYFEDRKVQLEPQTAAETRKQSPLISELGLRLSDDGWLDTEWHYDDKHSRTSQFGNQFSYQPNPDESYVLGYRYRWQSGQEAVEQRHAGLRYPLNERWGLSGFWQQNMQTKHSTDLMWGAEYQSCCWTVRTLWRRHLEVRPDDLATNQSNPDYQSGLYVQFELKGLSTVGNSQLSTLLRERLQPDSYP